MWTVTFWIPYEGEQINSWANGWKTRDPWTIKEAKNNDMQVQKKPLKSVTENFIYL